MKKVLCIIFSIIFSCALSSCYYQNTDIIKEYSSFLRKIDEKDKSMYSLLPKNDKMDYIQDIYLYYSDFDMMDSMYAIYVNCLFEQNMYIKETQRILEITEQWDFVEENVDSFDYDSVVIDQVFYFDNLNMGLMNYSYVLFDDNNSRIVYVFIFEKQLDGMSMNIPSDYLPKEIVALREKL